MKTLKKTEHVYPEVSCIDRMYKTRSILNNVRQAVEAFSWVRILRHGKYVLVPVRCVDEWPVKEGDNGAELRLRREYAINQVHRQAYLTQHLYEVASDLEPLTEEHINWQSHYLDADQQPEAERLKKIYKI
jgi:hypothetical protein